MYITNSTMGDIDTIFTLYDDAIAYQKTVFKKHWEGFERSLIETEIRENRQWKIVINNEIACIFVLTFNDALFWKEKAEQPAIYIHRIVTNSKFRGGAYTPIIVGWAKNYCKKHNKDFIRLDTWGDNPKLKDYYIKCGFEFLGIIDIENLGQGDTSGTEGLPKHYKGTLALFEIEV